MTHLAAVALLQEAYNQGIRYFDTANIYGQGDAERALGAASSRWEDFEIATKVGYSLPAAAGATRRLKPLLRLAANYEPAGDLIRKLRGRSQSKPRDESGLMASVAESLQRLRTQRIALLQLHNPPRPQAADSARYRNVLEAAKASDLCISGGVAVGTADDALEWVATGLVDAVQLPAGPQALVDLSKFREARPDIRLIGREVFAGGQAFNREWARKVAGTLPASLCAGAEALRDGGALRYLRWLADSATVDVALVGTTSISHLHSAVAALKEDRPC